MWGIIVNSFDVDNFFCCTGGGLIEEEWLDSARTQNSNKSLTIEDRIDFALLSSLASNHNENTTTVHKWEFNEGETSTALSPA